MWKTFASLFFAVAVALSGLELQLDERRVGALPLQELGVRAVLDVLAVGHDWRWLVGWLGV